MDYKCKDCGKIYEDYRPEFCECGNDKFVKISSQYVDNDDYGEKKENPVAFIIFLLLAVGLAVFLASKIRTYKAQPAMNDEYLTSVRKEMLKDFNPAGITKSGRCIISFEINEEGWVNKRHLAKKSAVPELNDKVYEMMQNATIVPKPPLDYTNRPILIEFGCEANQYEVECYSKNIEK